MLKVNESHNKDQIDKTIYEVRSMWVDLFTEVRENADGLKVISDKDQKKLVFTLQEFICELPDLDSINESGSNLESSMLGLGN